MQFEMHHRTRIAKPARARVPNCVHTKDINTLDARRLSYGTGYFVGRCPSNKRSMTYNAQSESASALEKPNVGPGCVHHYI